MAIRPLIEGSSPLLHREVKDVTKFDHSLRELLMDLEDTMFEADGVGIAAPQIGVDLKVALVDMEEDGILQLINPVITHYSTETAVDIEGCLSLPDIFGEVARSVKIELKGQDLSGRPIEMTAFDDVARAIQHEVDHLYGKLFTEKMIRQISLEELEEMYSDDEDHIHGDA
ncbi:peptide deformylase [Macrococcus equipercicus]|uniref:Peptide deformylase n=1 Tax=Macrococcus equipercicus TaxID=69967 RepID=A0A9Q9F1Z0_9STAP|nr:peptide deformylase [Macrococcus equipercicus]KAA1042742.1 peptide deformylase [Macrococcus equipercicus]UTH14608.1 peptide deformylase [Macrococcus equipercicus]